VYRQRSPSLVRSVPALHAACARMDASLVVRTWLAQRIAPLGRDPAVRQAAVIVVAMRLGLGLLAAVIVKVRPPSTGGLSGVLPMPHGLFDTYVVAPWERFDALDFERIAGAGYMPGQAEQHYFPLLPLLERGLSYITGGSLGLAGLVVSTVALFVALVCIHRLVSRDLDPDVASRTVLFVALAPVASFFLAPYTESLFLALSAAAILAARRHCFVAAAALATLATLSRPQGILVALPVAVEALIEARAALRERRSPPWSALTLLAAPAALAAFFVYTKAVSGLTPLESESLQMIHLAAPWQGFIDTLKVAHAHPVALVNAAILALCVAGLVLMLLRRPRLPLSYVVYTAASVLVIACRESLYAGGANPLVASDRFALVIFPLFVVLAWLTRRHSRVAATLLSVSAAVMLVRFGIYVTNVFAA
jgi:hypothetical protein